VNVIQDLNGRHSVYGQIPTVIIVFRSRRRSRLFPTPKSKIFCANRKFGLCSNRPKTVLATDLSVALTDKSVVTTDFVRFLKKLEVVEFETTDKIDCDNRFVGQGNR
jgi:hypothetical protein